MFDMQYLLENFAKPLEPWETNKHIILEKCLANIRSRDMENIPQYFIFSASTVWHTLPIQILWCMKTRGQSQLNDVFSISLIVQKFTQFKLLCPSLKKWEIAGICSISNRREENCLHLFSFLWNMRNYVF